MEVFSNEKGLGDFPKPLIIFGGADEIRTHDLFRARAK